MDNKESRELIISRVKKELIGPGSDIFECTDEQNYTDEVIEGKPLMRYFSGILYPKQTLINGAIDSIEDDDESEETSPELISDQENVAKPLKEGGFKKDEDIDEDKKDEVNYTANTFFPSQYGISFATTMECKELNVEISFGFYKKAKNNEVALYYDGDNIELLPLFGLEKFVEYDFKTKLLKQSKELTSEEKKLRSACQYKMAEEHRNSGLYKTISKLFFKDKYKRVDNKISFCIPVKDVLNAPNNHYKRLLSSCEKVNADKWWKGKIGGKEFNLKDNLLLHIKAYSKDKKYIFKAIIENTLQYPQKISLAKEIINQICLFQTEIKINVVCLKPFNDYKDVLFRSDEDKMLDYLYREKLAYGIGHNTACVWEECENDMHQPTWIASTFLPQYNVKSQSTEIDEFSTESLEIKKLSSFNNNKQQIINNLGTLCTAYEKWIVEEIEKSNDVQFASQNSAKCLQIKERIRKGINLLNSNDNAMRAFQLANTAIYLQMFQNEKYFNAKKDGHEAFEHNDFIKLSYEDLKNTQYPNPTSIPTWRPFQLAFIILCLPSFIEKDSPDIELVDLLYFPTGGGKTEAYLAVSAFLIFWRRLQFPNNYGGVNIIIRYTLRLLSAQQFERATKLILACEFIRQNNTDLGDKKITIGFWVGRSTIPNDIILAKTQLNNTHERLNKGQSAINPFQVSNCQWCNTKIIGRININSSQTIGHRINTKNELDTFCLNPNCNYSQKNGGLPIVLIDEDIYKNPPSMLFATVDKFAQLAWKEEATALFNHGNDRKPELIIQDELHLLNGPLGSLVGLFENVLLSLCTTDNQKPKIIASTATVKNVDKQIQGLYNRKAQIFPQNITSSDNTFFSKVQEESKRRYIGILPTGKTFTMANLRLNAALLFARIELWQGIENKADADSFWTILSYFKSLKNIGRFSNKISTELIPEIKQLQVRYLMNHSPYNFNYNKLSYRNLELTSRIPNEQIKKNLDKLSISFDGDLGKHQAYDLVLATNMISVGLDVGRLGVMLMNGMPPNTAEYIQASSRVARQNKGVVFTLFDPNNTRDLSYFEDFIPFHKTFYKQVEPLSVTPFAENALDKMLFTVMVTFFRHKMGYYKNKDAGKLKFAKIEFVSKIIELLDHHTFMDADDKEVVTQKLNNLVQDWLFKIDATPVDCLYYYGGKAETEKKKNLIIPIQDRQSENEIRVAMQSMRNVEPSAIINIKKY